jgi:vacuolar protein sorting-associated protein 54
MLFVCAEYVEFVRLLPLTHTTVISKVVELLTLYNSRVCQLILGASAMETVQLKSITATHLALASQAIQLMQTQIPVLKEELARYVSNQNHIVLLDAMDRVHGDYVNHQKEILQKLVAIMDHLVGRTAGKISRAAWIRVDYKESSLGGQASSGEMDQSLQVLWKQINSLHNTLSDLLLPSQRTFVFAQVGTSIQAHFLKAINDVYKSSVVLKTSPRSEHAINIRHRLCVILQHMLMKVRTIPSFQDDACVRLQREHDRIQQES